MANHRSRWLLGLDSSPEARKGLAAEWGRPKEAMDGNMPEEPL